MHQVIMGIGNDPIGVSEAFAQVRGAGIDSGSVTMHITIPFQS